jgi:zinc transporter 1/2/3
MFSNPCIGTLQYEATTGAIAMAGIFLTFLLEYLGNRIIRYKLSSPGASNEISPNGSKDNVNVQQTSTPHPPTLANLGHHHHHVEDVLSVMIMEAGIIFHSVSKYFQMPNPRILTALTRTLN